MTSVLLNPENMVTKALSERLRQLGQDFIETSFEYCGDLSTLYFGDSSRNPLQRPRKVWFLDTTQQAHHPQWIKLAAFTEELEWVNSPQALLKSNALINQLHIASICGFTLPECIATTDLMRLNQFYTENQDCVILSCQAAQDLAFEDLQIHAPILPEPVIMRRLVPTQNIVRVYIFKDDILSIRLQKGLTKDDSNIPNTHKRVTLDDHHFKAARRYARLMRLEYLTIDLALTQNDKLLFLNGYASEHIVQDDTASPDLGLMDSLCRLVMYT